MQLKAVIGAFFVECSKFENQCVGMALRSLSKDSVFVEHAETLLDLEARFKLLERLAFARGIPPALFGELEALLLRGRKLHDVREEVARNLASVETDVVQPKLRNSPSIANPLKPRKADYAQLAQVAHLTPTSADVLTYTAEAIELQHSLHALSEKLDRHLSELAACA